jgi:hypothetical protein
MISLDSNTEINALCVGTPLNVPDLYLIYSLVALTELGNFLEIVPDSSISTT